MIINAALLKKLIKCPTNLAQITNEKICEVANFLKTPFKKINNLVSGKVISSIAHPNSDHLHITKVDVGDEVLQIVCGAPNVDSGQYVIVAKDGAKLSDDFIIKPVKLRGVESNGMICALDEIGLGSLNFTNESGIFNFPQAVPLGKDIYNLLELDDFLIELEPTNNRTDLFSYLGYARDIASATKLKLNLKKYDYPLSNIKNPYTLSSEVNEVQFYEARYFDSLEVAPSPLWMQIILKLNNIDPINNIVDITNYIMLKYGTPMHAFDTNLISDNKIILRYSQNNEQITTLDKTKVCLTSKEVVISDLEKGLALGGIIGFDNARINNNTTSVLLESAIFDKTYIQNISQKLNISTDASKLYQRGVSKENLLLAIDEACFLITKLAKGRLSKNILKIKANYPSKNKIKITLSDINLLLGTNLKLKDIDNVFKYTPFEYIIHDEEFNFTIPDHRPDIVIKEQLINEFARLYGLNNLATTPKEFISKSCELETNIVFNKLKTKLAMLGLYEVRTYSLVNTSSSNNALELMESLKSGRKYMRENLLSSLLEVYNYNIDHSQTKGSFFEISDIYTKDNKTTKLAILLTTPLNTTSWLNPKNKELNFFTLKGVLDYIISLFNLEYELIKTNKEIFHPNYQAKIITNNDAIGQIGAILNNNELVYYLELDLIYLITNKAKNPIYIPFSRYPQMRRDIAMEIKKDYSYKEIKKIIIEAGGKYLKDVRLFDIYDKLSNSDYYSLAISLYFESDEETLNSDYINNLTTNIKVLLTKHFHASYR